MLDLETIKNLPIKKYVNVDVMKKDTDIDMTDLDTGIQRHVAMMTHYGVLASSAKKQYETIKNLLEILEAQLDDHYRQVLTESGTVKTTEKAVRNKVVSDERYFAMNIKLRNAREEYDLCEIARSAFSQRKDLIVELSRDRRKEREGQLRIMEQKELRQNVMNRLSSN